ncbi:MAG: hypothetical protein IJ072_07690, partial [Oscillospiraceae bacterium]|nr:hypothetical protein [Oscillospiraceae bacterium]
TFRRGGTVWYAGRMNDGETLAFTTDIPEILPNVMLRYIVRNGAVREFLLSQSGMDGALVFQDARSYAALPVEISRALPYDYDLDGDWESETIDLVSTRDGRWQLTVNGVPASGEAYAMDAELLTLWLADLDYDGVVEI